MYQRVILWLLCVMWSATAAYALTGTVIDVHDGDTYTVKTNKGAILKVRLQGADAPELKQDFGPEAQVMVEQWLLDNTVMLKNPKKDRYGRTAAEVFVKCDGAGQWGDIAEWLVSSGGGWWYKQYAPKRQDLRKAQRWAKDMRIGLWENVDTEGEPQPPWEWRKARRKK